MSDSPIFDQLVRERFGSEDEYRKLVAPSPAKAPVFTYNPTTLTKKPIDPHKDADDTQTMRIPRVVPLGVALNVA